MRTPEQIALQERLNEKKAMLQRLGKMEFEAAYEIQHLVRRQATVSDEIMMVEMDLEKLREKVQKNPMVDYANKLLKGMFP